MSDHVFCILVPRMSPVRMIVGGYNSSGSSQEHGVATMVFPKARPGGRFIHVVRYFQSERQAKAMLGRPVLEAWHDEAT